MGSEKFPTFVSSEISLADLFILAKATAPTNRIQLYVFSY
jgi:hypothetical protein